MTSTEKVAAGAAALLSVAAIGVGTSVVLSDSSPTVTAVVTTPPLQSCGDWGVTLTMGECQAAGIIRYVALYNLQGAAQFCKWRGANPGEWSRLNAYAGSETPPQNIVTWFGASIRNELEAYFATGAPPMSYKTPSGSTVAGIQPNPSPNACTGKVLAAPSITGVTPGQTDATVTIGG